MHAAAFLFHRHNPYWSIFKWIKWEFDDILCRLTGTWGSRLCPPVWPAVLVGALAAERECCLTVMVAGNFLPVQALHISVDGPLKPHRQVLEKVKNIKVQCCRVTVHLCAAILHFSPLGERTPGSPWADRTWPCDCLEEPAPGGFRLLPDTESESVDREGEAVVLWDWRKIHVQQLRINIAYSLFVYVQIWIAGSTFRKRSPPSWCRGLPYGSVGLLLLPWLGPCGSTHWGVRLAMSLHLPSTQWFPAVGGGPERDSPGPCGFQNQTRKARRMCLRQEDKNWLPVTD